MRDRAETIGELRQSGYRVLSVRQEMRKNLIEKIQRNEELFPGIVGYEDTVVPQIENAILSGHDVIFLGERGQAKSRIIRSLTNLLDDEVPVIAGCEIYDNPFAPICAGCRAKVAEAGDDVAITWLGREHRYAEKLATPDVSIADLFGEVDPIKVAEGRYLSDELTIHYGLIPRTNRGIFAINELPDLAEKVQVGLFNIMEERDIQIRGYRIRLPLDVYVVASANPEDYTNRGRIITPLKDRYGSQVRTHYPRSLDEEIRIVEAERSTFPDDGHRVVVPPFMKEIIAEVTNLARRSADVNQRSGVSVRVSISNYENMISNAYRRAVRHHEEQVSPRISDLPYIVPSTTGKIELETMDDGKEDQLVERLIQRAVLNIFNRYLDVRQFDDLLVRFKGGVSMEVSDSMPSIHYMQKVVESDSLMAGVAKLCEDRTPASIASAVEFILEGLHANRKLNKNRTLGRTQYRG
ncbi:MAG: magnesium chelatase [Chloroflexota bacterium]|nr:MAG: magnesium chelatase [Chloroflexota bacterium]